MSVQIRRITPALVNNSLFIIDGTSLLYNSYHSKSSSNIFTKSGLKINAVFGLLSRFCSFIKNIKPKHVVFVFDSFGNKRKLLFPAYKANRKPVCNCLYSYYYLFM